MRDITKHFARPGTKGERFDLRMSRNEISAIRRAARHRRVTMAAFVVASALAQAEDDLFQRLSTKRAARA